MNAKRRKMNLNKTTLRHLMPTEIAQVVGGTIVLCNGPSSSSSDPPTQRTYTYYQNSFCLC